MKKDKEEFKRLSATKPVRYLTPEEHEIEKLHTIITEQAARIKALEDALLQSKVAIEELVYAHTELSDELAFIAITTINELIGEVYGLRF